jgi:Fur family ferric uptake transcriptional regulator
MQASDRSWSERATAALSEAGFRSGGGRRQVVDLLGAEGCAITALEIDQRCPRSQGDVYRRSSSSRTRPDSEGRPRRRRGRLRAVEPSGHHHHHIVCEHCGRVVPFEDEGLERAIVTLAERPDFNVSSHDVTLRGECADCAGESA